jgi:hypothetical protein
MIDKSSLIKLLRTLIATIESLDQQQIDDLFAGKAKLAFAPTGKAKETNSAQFIDKNSLLDKLNQCKDRDEARGVLSAIATRDALADFARTLKVHVVKHDRREDIESKIVEFVVGGKLRSEAIRSVNLKGGAGRKADEVIG